MPVAEYLEFLSMNWAEKEYVSNLFTSLAVTKPSRRKTNKESKRAQSLKKEDHPVSLLNYVSENSWKETFNFF